MAGTIYGAGNSSCGSFIDALNDNDWGILMYKAWIQGYLVGIQGYQDLKETDSKGMESFVKQHCEKFPLDTIEEASFFLSLELVE